MHHIFRDKDKRPGGGARDTVAELEVELPAQDVEELILCAVDVQGWSTLQNFRITPHPKRTACLLARGENLGGILLLPDRPREAGSLVGKHDKSLFLVCQNC